MIVLQSPSLQFTCTPERAAWSLMSLSATAAWVEDACIAVAYQCGRRAYEELLQAWPLPRVAGPEIVPSPHGPLQQVRLFAGPDGQGVHYEMRFALAAETPLFLWQITITNHGSQPIHVERIDLLRAGLRDQVRPEAGSVRLHPDPGELGFFANGWQSWSYSGTYGPADTARGTRLGPVQAPVNYSPSTPVLRAPGHYASDFFGVLGDRSHRAGLLAGFLSQNQHFGWVEARTLGEATLRLAAAGDGARLAPGEQIHTDWAVLTFIDLDDPDGLAPYLDAAARQNNVNPRMRVPAGWCTWYHYYQKVTADDVRANTRALAALRPELPLELVQIDDGFESQVGDWFSFSSRFPEGVAPLAAEIRQAGFTPGLWLAPFIVHPDARLNRKHPEYLLRGRRGRPANAGYIWDRFTRALDLTHPGALEYAARVIEMAVREWGFPYLKLDFLYAGGLPGQRYDPARTRAQALRGGLEVLRQAAGPEAYLLGCGVPLGSALGICDAVRIGPDVSGDWLPRYHGVSAPFRREPSMPAVRNALQNVLTRAALHRRWWVNDPDCLLVRTDTRLTPAEVQALATAVALSGGSLIFSDDIDALPPERLRLAQTLLPAIGRRPRVLDWFDAPTPARLRLDLDGPAGAWHLLALFNWSDRPDDLTCYLLDFDLPARPVYLARSFWDQTTHLVEDGSLTFPQVPAHGVVLLAVRPLASGAQYLGSDLHISQGSEVAGWVEEESGLTVRLGLPRRARGAVELRLPAAPASAALDGRALEWEALGEGRYRFAVDFNREGELRVTYAREG